MENHIKNWIEAIDLTIERHEYALKNSISYREAKEALKKPGWTLTCPLCEYDEASRESISGCDACPWVKFEGAPCTSGKLGYNDDLASIVRLKRWKEKLLKEEK